KRRGARESTFEETEEAERRERHGDRCKQGAVHVAREDVGRERDGAAGGVRGRDRERASQRAARGRPLEAELEAHHEGDPRFRSPREGPKDGSYFLLREAIVAEDSRDLARLEVRNLGDLAVLARELALVMLGVSLRCEKAAEAHRDRARR